MRAVILAAQAASGLRPFSYTAPRAMLSLFGRPLLEPLLELLARNGFTEIVIATGHFSQAIENYFRDGRRFGLRLAYAFLGEQPGAVNPVEALRRIDARSGFCRQPIAVLEANGWFDLDFGRALAQHRERQAAATIVPGAGVCFLEPVAFETLLQPDSAVSPAPLAEQLRALRIPTQVCEEANHWQPLETVSDFWILLQRALRDNEPALLPPYPPTASGVFVGADISLPSDATKLTGNIWVGGGSVVDAGARIAGPAWIGANCRIAAGARLDRCIVEDSTRVGSETVLSDCFVVGNRAIDRSGAVTILGDTDCGCSLDEPPLERRPVQDSLLQLASRVAKRTVSTFS